MPNKVGIIIALDGEEKFANGMKSAEESARKFDQQLKNLEDEYKGNANSLEALTKKQELLKQKQDAANRALESAKGGLANAKKNYRDAGEALEKFGDELEEARKELQRMDDAGEKGTAAYKKQAKAVEDLEKKVNKQAQEQAKASINIDRWETKVAKADGSVKKMNTAVDKNSKYVKEASTSADKCATSIDKMGNEMQETAQEADKMGSGLKDALSVAVGNLMSQGFDKLVDGAKQAAEYIVDVGSTFEASMSKVEALSGASGAELEALSNKAKELGASTQYSASQVADAFGYMSLAGWKTEDMLQGIDGVLNLAAASGMDLATASDMVTDYLSAFSLTAADASHMVDMLAYAQANSNTTTQQLGDAFGNCAANMNAAGQDMETTTAILEAFANQGIKGSEAGTKLSAIMRDITAKMKDGKIQIGDTAVAVTDANGNFRDLTDILMDVESATNGMGDAEKAAALSATFTSRSVGGLNMIMNEGVGNIAAYEEALRSSDGAAASMAATMQNNFQGAVKDMDSALEGLGIAIWEKIDGPVTGAVDTLTGIIRGITDAITPEQTALEKFIADIGQANEAVQASIDNARSTVESGEAKAAEIEAYGSEIGSILEQCEQFNQVTLDNGKSAIVNASGEIVSEGFQPIATEAQTTEEILDQWASGGFNTEGIISSASTAKEHIGYVSEEADTVESRLERFASEGIDTSGIAQSKEVVVQLFDEMGQPIETFKTDVGEAGNVNLSTENISGATEAIITCFDDSSKSVESFKTGIENLSTGSLDLSTITSEFERVQDSITTTYHITDEFTKIKIDTMVAALGDSVEGLADAWDSTTGTLSASRQELENWFDTAKQVAMYSALQDAVNELYTAWGDSAVNMAKASSATEAALQAFNEEAGTTFKTAQEALDWMGQAETGWYDTADALNKAVDAENKTAESMRKADKELQNTVPRLEKYITGLGDQSEATEEASESNQGLAESFADLTEEEQKAIDAFSELTGKTTSELAELQSQLGMSNEEFANWCTERTKETQAVIDAYTDLTTKVAQSMHDFATAINASGEEGSKGIDNILSNLQKQTADLQAWVSNMKTLGEMAGKELPQALYDQLLADGPSKTAEAVQALVDAAQNETGKFEEVANQYNEALNIEAEAANLTAYSSTGKAYAEAVKEGFVGSQADYEAAVAEGMTSGAETAKSAAQGYTEAGQQAGQNIAEGEKGTEGEVTGASQAVVEAGIQSATTAADMFREVGRIAMLAVSGGMNQQKASVTDRAKGIIQDAKTAADGVAQQFNQTGTTAGSQFTSGLSGQTAAAAGAGGGVASAAYNAASSYSGSFYSVGVNMAQGVTSGIMSRAQSVANAAADMVRRALSSAKAAAQIASPSKRFREEVGKQIGAGTAWGVKQSTNLVVDAAESLIGQTLAAMSNKLKGASQSEVSYAWQQTANSFMDRAFGVSKYTTTGSGKNQKTVAKDQETYYNDVYKAAQTYMSRIKSLYDVSEEDELAYWKKVQAHLKVGTDAWYAATDQVKKLTEAVTKNAEDAAKEAEEKAKEALEAEKAMYEGIVNAADNYLNHLNIAHSTSIKRELAYWKAIRATLKAGTDAYDDASKKIAALEARIGTVDNAEKILDVYKQYYELSEGAEVEYWDTVRKQYAAGTQDRIDADKKYFEAKKAYTEKLKSLEDEYKDKVQEVNDELEKGIDDLNQKYDSAVQQRAQAIYSAFGFQDEFESESKTGKQLLFNAESQAAGYEFWRDELNDLESRQILSDKVIKELRDQGPKEVATVVALNSLSDEELQRFQDAQDKKWNIALEQSKKENEELKKETEIAIQKLKDDAAEQTKKLTDNYTENRKAVEGTINSGLKGLAGDIKNISEDEVNLLAAALGGVLKDQDARSSTGKYVSESAITAASGAGSVAHNGNATHDAGAEILSTGSKRSTTVKDSEKGYSDLFKHIVEKYGVQPGQSMYKALGSVLGVKTSDTVTGSEMSQIYAAMRKQGLRRGTKDLQDAFAWMDEAGIGSELIVRKSDGAILNTAMQRGDAIIPADLTENLYRWGAYNPDIVLPQVMSAARMNAMAEQGYRSVGGATESSSGTLDQMLALMAQFLPYMAERTHVSIDGRGLVDYTSQEMAKRSRRVRG